MDQPQSADPMAEANRLYAQKLDAQKKRNIAIAVTAACGLLAVPTIGLACLGIFFIVVAGVAFYKIWEYQAIVEQCARLLRLKTCPACRRPCIVIDSQEIVAEQIYQRQKLISSEEARLYRAMGTVPGPYKAITIREQDILYRCRCEACGHRYEATERSATRLD